MGVVYLARDPVLERALTWLRGRVGAPAAVEAASR